MLAKCLGGTDFNDKEGNEMTYEQRLLAAGIDPKTAMRDAWANALQWLNNREAERYASEQCADGGPEPITDYADRRCA